MTTSSNKNAVARRPRFMGEQTAELPAHPASFAAVPEAANAPPRLAFVKPEPARPASPPAAPAAAKHPAPPAHGTAAEHAAPVMVPAVHPVAPPAPPPPAGPSPRLEAAIEALRLRAARLAEEARSDALEIGFMVARRILEQEMTVSPQPLFALIRSAIRRAGESRKLVVRLPPSDLAKVETARASGDAGSLSLATIELVPDPSLESGDCVVEGDLGTVDGRLASRFVELARALEPSGGDAA